MKSIATHKLTRMAVAISAAGCLFVATAGDALAGPLSDERLKQEIEPVESALTKLRSL